MQNRLFLNYLLISLLKERSRHIGVVLLSLLLIFLLSSVLFISTSIQTTIQNAIKSEPDFVIQRVKGGLMVPLPLSWIDDIEDIRGISTIQPRVWGRYTTASSEPVTMLIVGIDPLDPQSNRAFSKMMNQTDIKSFLDGNNMIVGSDIAKWMDMHYAKKSYRFLSLGGEFISVNRFATLPKSSNLISGDMVIVPLELAQKILNYDTQNVTDIILNVPNHAEWSNLKSKLEELHYDIRVVSKQDSIKAYKQMFDYKGGFFLALFMIVLLAFAMILYQRYTQVLSTEKKQIGILRALGWSVQDVLRLKMYETVIVIIFSYILAVTLAYIYVFIAHAPLLQQIFLGTDGYSGNTEWIPVINLPTLMSILLLYAVPYFSAVIIPVWRIAVTDPKEAML